jgi:hypothetical protein
MGSNAFNSQDATEIYLAEKERELKELQRRQSEMLKALKMRTSKRDTI